MAKRKGAMVPYEKLSKKQKKEWEKRRRGSWGAINPVTRRPEPLKKYNRSKSRQWKEMDDSSDAGIFGEAA